MKTQYFRKIFLSICAVSALFFSVNCDSFTGGDGEQLQSRATPTVIVAGYTGLSGTEQACYWFGTPGEALTKVVLHDASWTSSIAKGLAVSGSTIYIVGYYNNGTAFLPCYWVMNSTGRVDLEVPVTTTDSSASRIFVAGGDIYTMGYYYDGVTTTYCYWINGIRTNIDTGATGTLMNYISNWFLYDNTIYGTGRCAANQVSYFAIGDQQYWMDPAVNGEASIIFVNRSGVHLIGYDTSLFEYKYWLNGIENSSAAFGTTDMSSGGNHYANDLFISENVLYVAGENFINNQACYWVNGTLLDLANGTNFSSAYAIQYFEGHVYICGYDGPSGTQIPCYWIDNQVPPQYLDTEVGHAYVIWDPYMDKSFNLEQCMQKIKK